MLDQPFLSFKNPSVSSNSANIQQPAIATTDKHRFSDVLKDTETAMQLETNNNDVMAAPSSPTLLNTDTTAMGESVLMPSMALAIPRDPTVVKSDMDIDVNIGISEIINADKLVLEESLSARDLSHTLSKAPDNNIAAQIENTNTAALLVPTLAGAIQPQAQASHILSTPALLANDIATRTPSQSPMLAESLIEQPLVMTKTPLANAITTTTPISTINVAASPMVGVQFNEQLSKLLQEGSVAADASLSESFNTEILKDIGPSNLLSTNSQATTASINKLPMTMTVPFQQAQWGSAVAEKVMWLNNHGLQEASIQLDPPELGPLQVKISVENDQAHVSFVVQNAQVKEALEQTAARLREMFDAEGIDLLDVDVSDQSAEEQQDPDWVNQFGHTDESQNEATLSEEAMTTSYIATPGGIDAYA